MDDLYKQVESAVDALYRENLPMYSDPELPQWYLAEQAY